MVRSSFSGPEDGIVSVVETDVAKIELDHVPVSVTAWYSDGAELDSGLQLLYAYEEHAGYSTAEMRRINAFTYSALLPKGEHFVRVSGVDPFAYGTAYRGRVRVGEVGGNLLDARILRGGNVTVYGQPGPLEAVGASFGCDLSIGPEGNVVFPNVPPGMWHFIQGDRRVPVVVQANGKHVVQL